MNDDTFEIEDGRPDGWFRIDHALLTEYGSEIGAYGIAVYAALAHHVNAQKECWPSYNRIVALTGISRGKVIQTIEKLEQLGLIRRKVRHTPDSEFANLPNVYVLLPLVDIIPRKRSPKGGVHHVDSPVQDVNPPVHHKDSGSSPRIPKQESINKNQEQESIHAPRPQAIKRAVQLTPVMSTGDTFDAIPAAGASRHSDQERTAVADLFIRTYPLRNGVLTDTPEDIQRAFLNVPRDAYYDIIRGAEHYAASAEAQRGIVMGAVRWILGKQWQRWQQPEQPKPTTGGTPHGRFETKGERAARNLRLLAEECAAEDDQGADHQEPPRLLA